MAMAMAMMGSSRPKTVLDMLPSLFSFIRMKRANIGRPPIDRGSGSERNATTASFEPSTPVENTPADGSSNTEATSFRSSSNATYGEAAVAASETAKRPPEKPKVDQGKPREHNGNPRTK